MSAKLGLVTRARPREGLEEAMIERRRQNLSGPKRTRLCEGTT